VKRPFRIADGLAHGPGLGDMKGGTVQMLYALKALHALGRETPPISVFLTSDEEVGSARGRAHIEEIARRSDSCLVFEASVSPGSIGIRRWGTGAYYVTIHGHAAPVLDPATPGANATRELALKILALESLSDPVRGVKVSVNLVRGGTSRQVTAPEARADVDVRLRGHEQVAVVDARVRDVAGRASLPGISIEVAGGMSRPPMQPTASHGRVALARDRGGARDRHRRRPDREDGRLGRLLRVGAWRSRPRRDGPALPRQLWGDRAHRARQRRAAHRADRGHRRAAGPDVTRLRRRDVIAYDLVG
jgi:glutamate carboxypeptidase